MVFESTIHLKLKRKKSGPDDSIIMNEILKFRNLPIFALLNKTRGCVSPIALLHNALLLLLVVRVVRLKMRTEAGVGHMSSSFLMVVWVAGRVWSLLQPRRFSLPFCLIGILHCPVKKNTSLPGNWLQ